MAHGLPLVPSIQQISLAGEGADDAEGALEVVLEGGGLLAPAALPRAEAPPRPAATGIGEDNAGLPVATARCALACSASALRRAPWQAPSQQALQCTTHALELQIGCAEAWTAPIASSGFSYRESTNAIAYLDAAHACACQGHLWNPRAAEGSGVELQRMNASCVQLVFTSSRAVHA